MSAEQPSTTGSFTVPADQSPLTVDAIKDAIRLRHKLAVIALGRLREERDKLNGQIRVEVAEVAEAARLLRALEPRPYTPKAETT